MAADMELRIPDLGRESFSTSLHEWLFAPHGTGMLGPRKDRAASTGPLMAAGPDMDGNIRKLEEIGTHPAASLLAVGDEVTCDEGIGSARKLARMLSPARSLGRAAAAA